MQSSCLSILHAVLPVAPSSCTSREHACAKDRHPSRLPCELASPTMRGPLALLLLAASLFTVASAHASSRRPHTPRSTDEHLVHRPTHHPSAAAPSRAA